MVIKLKGGPLDGTLHEVSMACGGRVPDFMLLHKGNIRYGYIVHGDIAFYNGYKEEFDPEFEPET